MTDPNDLSPSWPSDEVNSVSDELDIDAWIDGTCGLTRTARVYQRGDLITKLDAIERELEVAKKTPKDQRGVEDKTPETLQAEYEEIAEQLVQSAMVFHVQDRTEERRFKLRQGLLKELKVSDETKLSFEDSETINIRVIADAIVKVESNGKTRALPEGFPPNSLRALIQSVGDAALGDLWLAFRRVTMEAPHISAPLSRRSSSEAGGIT